MTDDWPYSYSDRIRYGDLDTNRHLNNVAVHQFFESARIAYMRELLPEYDLLARDNAAVGMIFAETHVNFRSPGFYEEHLTTQVRIDEVRRSSVRLQFRILAGERLVAEGWGTLVGYDYAANRASPLPELIAARLREAHGG